MAYEIQFSALGDSVRSAMIEMLRQRSYPVHELAAAFPISRPAISRHLRVLKEAGFVIEIKRGRENHYSLQQADFAAMSSWLGNITATAKPAAKSKAAKRPSSPKKMAPVTVKPESVVQRAPVKTAKPPVLKPSLVSQMEFEL